MNIHITVKVKQQKHFMMSNDFSCVCEMKDLPAL